MTTKEANIRAIIAAWNELNEKNKALFEKELRKYREEQTFVTSSIAIPGTAMQQARR